MQFALVLFELPSDPKLHQSWQTLIQTDLSKRQEAHGGLRMINDCAYTCDLQNGLAPLTFIINYAQNAGLATSALFFPDEPTFSHTDGKQVKI